MGKAFKVESHGLVPKHIKLSEAEKKKLLEKYIITVKELPKILRNDPIILEVDAKAGDVIKIVRRSPVAGETFYYRAVVNE